MCENRFPEMDEVARSLMGSFKRLHYTLHKNMAGNVKHDLKMSPFFVMNHLLRADRMGQSGVRVSDIAASMGITVSGITQIITGLEKKQLIRREMDPDDRRAVLVSLTDDGRKIMEPVLLQMKESFSGLIDHLGDEHSRQLAELLLQVEAYFGSQD